MARTENSRSGWYFLLGVIVAYAIIALIKPDFLLAALGFFWNILKMVMPVFLIVFIIMFIINYYVTPKWLVDKMGKRKGLRRWVIAIAAGIISTGPIYMWYPLLSELKEHGADYGVIAAFLYSRAIKPALFPLMIFYFGLAFTVILTFWILVFSVLQGLSVEALDNLFHRKTGGI